MTLEQFLNKKRHSVKGEGLKAVFMPDKMFPHQKFAVTKALDMMRYALFIDTGLGKTLMELVLAQNVVQITNKKTLICTPLAVAYQFVREASKFGIDDVEHSKNGKHTKKIVVCNYERLEKFDPNDFECIILDESSILKNFDGVMSGYITAFMKKIPMRYLFTATPSPNDFTELGTSSEALGYMGYTDMMGKYFKNEENTIDPQSAGTKWRFKGHAEGPFFDWVSSWSLSMRMPSDLGFSDDGFVLPDLIVKDHFVRNENPLIVNGQYSMFAKVAKTNSEILAEQKATINQRCEKAVELASNWPVSVYWINLDKEAPAIKELDKEAVVLQGAMDVDKKEEILMSFQDGQINKLITKAKITAFGLNWQHCGHAVFFPTFSYEQYKQARSRFWRLGRTEPVHVDRVLSDGQIRVIQSIDVKQEKADKMFSSLNRAINTANIDKKMHIPTKINLPSFI